MHKIKNDDICISIGDPGLFGNDVAEDEKQCFLPSLTRLSGESYDRSVVTHLATDGDPPVHP
jgi:hypothetical protein